MQHLGFARVFTRPLVVGVLVVVALSVVKLDTLAEPPAWDAAMSVHPAALTLAENGFDYPALLAMPTILEGGPNTHSLSSYTALTAIAYSVLPASAAIVALHLLTFMMAGFTAAAVVRIAGRYLPPALAAGVGVVCLAVPVILTQFGMVYLDAPVLAASAWAMVAALERRWVASAGFSLLATTIKPSGLVTAAAVAWLWLVVERSASKALATAVPSLLVVLAIRRAVVVPTTPSLAVLRTVATSSWRFVSHVPDILVFLALATAAALILDRSARGGDRELAALWAGSVLAFVGMYGFLWSVAYTTLPRYYIQILPWAVIVIVVGAYRWSGVRAAWFVVGVVAAFSVVNFNGQLYPLQDDNNFALMERSDAYDDLLAMEVAAARAVCELPADVPVMVTGPELFRLSYPDLGYADCPNRPIQTLDLPEGADVLAAIPSQAYITYELHWLGGRILEFVIDQAAADPDWSVEVVEVIRSGKFAQEIYLVTRNR